MSPDDPTVLPGVLVKHRRTTLEYEDDINKRTSNLFAPKESLEDHTNSVVTCDIDPTGELILSGGSDCLVRICPIYANEAYVMVMSGHTGTIMEVSFSYDGSSFFTCSFDKTVASWDTSQGLRVNNFKGHQAVVNSVKKAEKSPILCSGSSDRTLRIWDLREKKSTMKLSTGYRIMATSFTGTENQVICAGQNNDIQVWDLRKNETVCTFAGHGRGVTGIQLSPCHKYLLSHSYDNTICTWDMQQTQPIASPLNVFPSYQGIERSYLLRCSWSQYGLRIAAGSANPDEINIWEMETCQILHTIRGHTKYVNDVKFHPYEPIILTASNDNRLIIQELPI